MFENILKNNTFVNNKMIHRAQIALHSKKSNVVFIDSFEFFIHIQTSVNNDLIFNANVIIKKLKFDKLKLQTQTQT